MLLDQQWQQHIGDLSFGDHIQGENLAKLKQMVALTVNPFVSTDSSSFKMGVEKDLFAQEGEG